MLADLRLPGQLYHEFILPDGDLLQAEGDTRRWIEKWQVQSEIAASEMQQTVNDWITAETNWWLANGGWRFQDDGGEWETAVKVTSSGSDQLLFDITIHQV